MRYQYYRCNFEAVIPTMKIYLILKDIDDAADSLFIRSEILPFHAAEITAMGEGCGFDSGQLQQYMKDVFLNENDTGVFSADELAEYIILGLNGDQEEQKTMCKKVMRRAVKEYSKIKNHK